ncbi:MAG: ABC transporter ATP-binding protein [Planctomycetaceae bacterium]|nr:ABC transporter ATP-binding protein [Planctomycetaceae bacterium]
MSETAHSNVVQIENLTKHYGEFVALDSLSLTLQKGDILGFIGPNGAGKTTTIKILVGLTRPTRGVARIGGADCVSESRKVRRLIGYMPDKFGSYDNMRVREYLDFFGAAYGVPRSERRRRVAEVLEITNATWMQDRYVESLSHGMQQRIGIARTLIHQPEVLILDEPANGLDPQARIEMREILLRLADEGKTLIVTSHILPELARICDRVAIIAGGKLRALGNLKEVTAQLTQRRTFEVQCLGADHLTAIENQISRAIGDADVSASDTEGIVRFRTAASDEQLSGLLKTLITAGTDVTQFREVAGDLEEAFVTATQAATADSQTSESAGESVAADASAALEAAE